MGRTFLQNIGLVTLVLSAFWQKWEIYAYASEIQWPAPPSEASPAELDEPLLRRPAPRHKRKTLDKPALPKSAEEIEQEKLKELQERPSSVQKIAPLDPSQGPTYSSLLQLGLHLPWIRTAGSKRKEYEVEPSSLIELLFNTSPKTTDHWQPWWGFGMVSLQGRGIYDDVPGRFGYLLLGPRFAFVKMHSKSTSTHNTSSPDGKKAGSSLDLLQPDDRNWQRTQVFSLGVNARISTNRRETSLKTGDNEDFNSRTAFDKPGLSVRYSYQWFFGDGFAGGPGLGGALLTGKSAYWLEFGVSLFL